MHTALGSEAATGRSVGFVTTRTVRLYTEQEPLVLECGATLGPVDVAYETYGTLDDEGGNVVVVCHALTGDAHAAGHHGDRSVTGWWETMIGPGKPVDTDRFFVVSSNLLGGCKGTTGPSSRDPGTGRSYGLRFPHFTVSDLVAVQRRLVRRLGIDRIHAAIGGSLGGMQALLWAIEHPGELRKAVLIGVAPRLSAQAIALSAVARASIVQDEHFQGGDYYGTGRTPDVGLAIARMLAHVTYLSHEALELKFGRRRRNGLDPTFDVDFEVESYLRYQGEKFLRRFDANSYLYLSRALDYFDPFADETGSLERLEGNGTQFLVLSFDTDWRFPTRHARELVAILERAGCDVRFEEIESPWGHDSFLLALPEYLERVAAFVAT